MDAMVIDTNVLEHAFNPTENRDGHIDTFLRKFAKLKLKIGIDKPGNPLDTSRIIKQYKHRLRTYLLREHEEGDRLYLLRYVIEFAEREESRVDFSDQLGRRIESVMSPVNAETHDKLFVYVACVLDRIMVSNDRGHVNNLRDQLRNCALVVNKHNTDFVNSVEAELVIRSLP